MWRKITFPLSDYDEPSLVNPSPPSRLQARRIYHSSDFDSNTFWNGSEGVLITSQPHSTNCGRTCVGLKHFEEF